MKVKLLESFSFENINKYNGNELIDYLRSSLTDLFLVVFSFVATIAVLSSITRALDTGWLPLYTIHLIMLITIYLVTIFRNRIKSTYKALLLIAILLLAGIGGYLQFGLAVQNSYLFFIPVLFSVLMLPFKITIVISILSILSFITMIILFHLGILTVDTDIVFYIQSPTTSILKIVGFLFIVVIIFFVLSFILKLLVEVLNTLHTKTHELETSKHEIQHIANVKSIFLANMSHEIRTPMNGIIGFINQLNKTELDQKQKEYLDIIHNSSQHLLSLINDVLDLSKINSEKLDINYSAVFLKEELSNTLKLFETKANEKNIQINFDCTYEETNKVLADTLRIKQVISNLMSNAIKFTPQFGNVTLYISQENSISESIINFSLQDSGIGMTQDACEKIFNPFEQAENSTTREYGGTGLGLSISHKLVALMGGELKVESSIGLGSRFFFTLKLQKAQEENTKESTPEVIQPSTSPLLILVAEDNKTNQMLLKLLLQEDNMNHDIIIVGNGKDALNQVKKRNFDIIFMDIKMPIMDGIQATQEIRDYELTYKRESVYIVALTANVFKEDQEAYIKAGMNGFLAKPILPKELFAILSSFLK